MTEVTQPATTENPLLEGLSRRTAEPCVLTIFGASGDLTQRKLLPALYSLAYRHLLPEKLAVVGVARTEMDTDGFVARMREAIEKHCRDPFREEVWDELAGGMRYLATDFSEERAWEDLVEILNEMDETRGTRGNRVYYLAIPPSGI